MLDSLIKNITGGAGLTDTPWGKTDNPAVEAALAIAVVVLAAAKAIDWVRGSATTGAGQDKAA